MPNKRRQLPKRSEIVYKMEAEEESLAMENGLHRHNGTGALKRQARKGSTLHRESEIKVETAELEVDPPPRKIMSQVLGGSRWTARRKEGKRHEAVAGMELGEFERRLVQAKKLRKNPLPDVFCIR